MTRKTIEGSIAVAEVVKNCNPGVVACYPITPSTHIAETLNKYYADGELRSYIAVESEFSAMSALVGGSAAGERTFTVTSSQGLALMHEVLFMASGARLPIVAVVANRALSAPLSIFNDHQDSISERDSGWIQLYCESIQESVDAVPQAYKTAEEIKLPVIICMDGFYLTHSVEQVDIPDKDLIDEYLPKYKPEIKLDPGNPISIGTYAMPDNYQSFREDLEKDMIMAKDILKKNCDEYQKLTKRFLSNGLFEEYKCSDAEYLLIAMGSIVGNIKIVVDSLREKGGKVGVLRIKSFRPFPKEVRKILENKKSIGVFEKNISPGGANALYAEILNSLYDSNKKPVVSGFIGGLGQKDISLDNIKEMFEIVMSGKKTIKFI